jgi:putative hemolysin
MSDIVSAIGGKALVIVLLIAINGVLAMSEIAVVSARKARLRQRAEEGDAGAAAALELAEEPTRFLSTVQVGITLVGIFAGAFGGATLAEEVGRLLDGVPIVGPYGDAIGLVVVVGVITYLSLIFGELVPKRIGLANAEAVAAAVARPMRLLSTVAGPVVGLFSRSTEAVLGLLRVSTSADTTVTEDEIRVMIAEGTQAGVFEEAEREIVDSVFRFADRRVGELMVPRPRIVWLDVEDPPDVRWQRIATTNHTCYPVARGDLDQLLGVVSIRRVSAELLAGRRPDLTVDLAQPAFVPETMTALQLLDQFRAAVVRVGIVVDEHGTIVGLVTPTDILEALVGDLPETGAEAGPTAVRREDGSWLVDGLLPVEELAELLDLEEPSDEERGDYRTVGGLVMYQLSRIPTVGDRLSWRGLDLEVVDMDGRRVDKVLVTPAGQPSAPARVPTVEQGST